MLMTSLAEIEAAAQLLSPSEKQRLLLYLAASLRHDRGKAPEPRQFVREQLTEWIAEDEDDLRRLREGS